MAPIRNARVIFNSIPSGYPEPGKTTVYDDKDTIDLDNIPLRGFMVLKTLVLSIDPYLRGRMRPKDVPSYIDAFTIGEPLVSHGVGVVVRTDMAGIKHGDHLYGYLPHQEYSIHTSVEQFRLLENYERLPWSVYVGAAGMPGKTAFMAWNEFSRAKRGETVFVSGGGGPVGSMVIQLAKHLGLKVIASAGTAEKVKFMKEIGTDVPFNYKTTKTGTVLEKEGPIDIFWDNVGGETLDAALTASSVGARFIECGMISGYNEGPKPIHNLIQVVVKSISMYGFVVFRLEKKYENDFYATIPPRLARGELKYTEEIWDGLDKVGDAILAVQKGDNKGKAVVKLANE